MSDLVRMNGKRSGRNKPKNKPVERSYKDVKNLLILRQGKRKKAR